MKNWQSIILSGLLIASLMLVISSYVKVSISADAKRIFMEGAETGSECTFTTSSQIMLAEDYSSLPAIIEEMENCIAKGLTLRGY